MLVKFFTDHYEVLEDLYGAIACIAGVAFVVFLIINM